MHSGTVVGLSRSEHPRSDVDWVMRGARHIPGGKMFRAFDKRTGEIVWEKELPGGTTAAPISYMVDGRQYIVATVGWHDMSSEYIALALPDTVRP